MKRAGDRAVPRRRNAKPIRKCRGCELNFGSRCGHYPSPYEMWLAGACPGYNNQQLIAKVQQKARQGVPPTARRHRRQRQGPRQRGRYGGAIGRGRPS